MDGHSLVVEFWNCKKVSWTNSSHFLFQGCLSPPLHANNVYKIYLKIKL